MTDPTEEIRKELVRQINANPGTRMALEALYGHVWDTEELTRDFEVLAFAAPFAEVIRKFDGHKGSLEFQHAPRFYYDFRPDA